MKSLLPNLSFVIITTLNHLTASITQFFCIKLSLPHSFVKLNNELFNLLYADSGYWDYTLLYTFQYLFNLLFVNTSSAVTSFSLIEKASFLYSSIFNLVKTIICINTTDLNLINLIVFFVVSTILLLLLTVSI